ncbi:MAG TPA: efflux RND transporter periplasmic adaptor subunit [Candidatus Eisenbacteria bacterium]|nr:efflux RND transporter periplasmic adaptor subunit [Candidatus Eisenbacteria bacterium]
MSAPASRVRLMASGLAKGVLVLALLLVLGLAYAYGGRLFGSGNDKPLVSVTGTIEAIQVDVSAKIVGRIAERPVNEGDRVTAGQLLVRLDEAEQAAEVRRQEAAVRTAQSTLDDLLAGARREEMEDARAALQSASATREWTQRDFQRAEGLFRQALIAAQEVDRARQAYEVAAAQEKSARQKLLLLEAGSRPDQVEAARGQLAQARNALDMARTRLKEMAIFSPLDGVVLRKNLEVGELANPGVPILTLMKPSDIWVRAYVPEEEVARIKVGSPARVAVDGYPARRFPGRIIEIASEAEFTPRNVQTRKERVNLVFRIKIAVDNPEGILKPGMPADADID